jgi:hypothetical protein
LLSQVGFSHDDLDWWRVHPGICNADDGWHAFVNGPSNPRFAGNRIPLAELVHRYGRKFGLWLLWPAGINESKYLPVETPEDEGQQMNPRWREHLFSGVLDAPQWLADYSPLLDFCRPLGIDVYGYIGRPYEDSPWDQVIGAFDGFAGLAGDCSAECGPEFVPLFDGMRRDGKIWFLESTAAMSATHLHGYPVAREYHLQDDEKFEQHGLMGPNETRARGGFTLFTLNHWERQDGDDKQKYRHRKAVELLGAGYHVAVPFDQLAVDDPAAEIVRAV